MYFLKISLHPLLHTHATITGTGAGQECIEDSVPWSIGCKETTLLSFAIPFGSSTTLARCYALHKPTAAVSIP